MINNSTLYYILSFSANHMQVYVHINTAQRKKESIKHGRRLNPQREKILL